MRFPPGSFMYHYQNISTDFCFSGKQGLSDKNVQHFDLILLFSVPHVCGFHQTSNISSLFKYNIFSATFAGSCGAPL